jgi:hypothetical protein
MESNPQLELAFDYLENTGVNVFLTGKAGTGKTTFLQELKKRCPKRMVVLAPTGVAAINAGGVTIHSFFQLPFGPFVPGMITTTSGQGKFFKQFSREKISIVRSVDLLVIDEISMVRADVLDAVDDTLRRYRDRRQPFGGVQLLMIGDMRQLAPVVKEEDWALLKDYYESMYFFHSKALGETSYVPIELKKVYRQQDGLFLDLLNKVRESSMDEESLRKLNERHVPGFVPGDDEGYITLTTHNRQAHAINEARMKALGTEPRVFRAEVKDDFPEYAFPTDRELTLKVGAQVMFVKNDSAAEKRYYNGKIGKVVSIATDAVEVRGKEDDVLVRVTREEWANNRYTIDGQSRELVETVVGTFRQFPLKSAWAITIHKSQGLTFDKAVIDSRAAFAPGQVYVALSRCRTIEGLVLSAPVREESMMKDGAIERFVEETAAKEPGREAWREACKEYYRALLVEQFNYDTLMQRLDSFYHQASEHLYRLYPEFVQRYREERDQCQIKLQEVATRFQAQLARIAGASDAPGTDAGLADRVAKGREYFAEHTGQLAELPRKAPLPEVDNKEARKALSRALEQLEEACRVKVETLKAMEKGFDVKTYLTAKARAHVPPPRGKAARGTPARGQAPAAAEVKVQATPDILHPLLYEELRAWRKGEAERQGVPVYTILQQRALLGISNLLPSSRPELLIIPGVGKLVAQRHGDHILGLVMGYRQKTDK